MNNYFKNQIRDYKSKDSNSLKGKKGIYVTAFTDASFCPMTKAAGWGIWIKFGVNGSTYRDSGGYLSKKEDGSAKAELDALERVVDILINYDKIDVKDKIVIIQSDCKWALQNLSTDKITSLGATRVDKRWVKGHNGKKDKRSAINTWCDAVAKDEMRIVRKWIRSNE